MPKTLPGGLVVYTTADWGARPAAHAFAATTPRDIVLHHMDWPNREPIADHAKSLAAAFDVARRCQADHIDANHWSDTGQHFTVTIDGIVLEGRHGSLDALIAGHCIRGAHAADESTGADDNDSFGTEHEGTYTSAPVPAAQWNASVKLQAAIAFLCRLDTASIKGHRDTGCSTACPGNAFEASLVRFRSDVHQAKVALMQAHGGR
ncbi:MAG: N-acetylmuramoyl-L-alanine amidase [Candidatus Eremiobacteraeota bacterium]|nr:N-acetylmuramoyl-L-alanine amidase [Candidatus Eremiobacteraeota bacterium]